MDNILKNPALFIWKHTICTENTQHEEGTGNEGHRDIDVVDALDLYR